MEGFVGILSTGVWNSHLSLGKSICESISGFAPPSNPVLQR